MNYFELHKKIEEQFLKNGVTELADIDWIMVHVLKVSRGKLPLVGEISIESQEEIERIADIRSKHVPLAYILGESDFYGRSFKVSPAVLIPRMDTEILIETVLKEVGGNASEKTILDVGTGSGAIIITLALELGSECTAVDISKKALEVAKANAKNLGANVKFIRSNLFEKLSGQKFDIIVSNPPYIESSVIDSLEEEVKGHEPMLALDGGESGIEFYERIIRQAKDHLNSNGMLFFEIGYNQAEEVSRLMEHDFEEIKVIKDYGDNDRVVYGKLR